MGKIYLNGIGYGGLSGPCEGDRVYIDQKLLSGTHIADIIVNDIVTPIYAPPGAINDVLVKKSSSGNYISVKSGQEAKIDLSTLYEGKQDKLTAGSNITITNGNVISANKTSVTVVPAYNGGILLGTISVDSTIKQLYIPTSEVMGVTDVQVNNISVLNPSTTVANINTSDIITAGENINITNGVISATNTSYTAGDNIDITNDIISADIPVLDVNVNGSSVVDDEGIAQIKSYREITQAEYNELPSTKLTDNILYAIKDGRSSSGGGTAFESYLNQGLVGETGSSYVTCNLDKTLTPGYYLVFITDDDTTYSSAFEWTGTTLDLNILGTLEITSTTAGLTQYNSPFRDIYCDIIKINLEYNNLPAVSPSDHGKVLAVNNSGNWDVLNVEEVPEQLPEVTTADNGKVLKVIEGMWNKGDLPQINEVPNPLSTDIGKVLKATGADTYSWGQDESLPSATSADEGKVLTVDSNGDWIPEDIPSQLPSVTILDNEKILKVTGGQWTKDYPSAELPNITSLDDGKILKIINGSWDKANEKTELPSVTPSDNGKVLTVISGNWETSYAPTELPAVTTDDNNKVLMVKQGLWSKENIVFPTELPAVTTNDNNKVLMVKQGAWTKDNITFPTELPSVTVDDNNKVLIVKNGIWTKDDAPETQLLPEVTVLNEGMILKVNSEGEWDIGIDDNDNDTVLQTPTNGENLDNKYQLLFSETTDFNGNKNESARISSELTYTPSLKKLQLDNNNSNLIIGKDSNNSYPYFSKITKNKISLYQTIDSSASPSIEMTIDTTNGNPDISLGNNYTWDGTNTSLKTAINSKANKATTIAGYNIADAYLSNEVIHLGNNYTNLGTKSSPRTEYYSLRNYTERIQLWDSIEDWDDSLKCRNLTISYADLIFGKQNGQDGTIQAYTWDGTNTSLKTAVTSAKDSVKQENTSSGGLYRVLLSNTTSDNPHTGQVRKTSTLIYNPLTYELTIGANNAHGDGTIKPAFSGTGAIGSSDARFASSYINHMHGADITIKGSNTTTEYLTEISSCTVRAKEVDTQTSTTTAALTMTQNDIFTTGSTWDGIHTSLKDTIQAILARL